MDKYLDKKTVGRKYSSNPVNRTNSPQLNNRGKQMKQEVVKIITLYLRKKNKHTHQLNQVFFREKNRMNSILQFRFLRLG